MGGAGSISTSVYRKAIDRGSGHLRLLRNSPAGPMTRASARRARRETPDPFDVSALTEPWACGSTMTQPWLLPRNRFSPKSKRSTLGIERTRCFAIRQSEMIRLADLDRGHMTRELSVSPDGGFWIDVVARPEVGRPSRWCCEVSLHRRLPDSSSQPTWDLGSRIGESGTLHDRASVESAIEYGRALGLHTAEKHAVKLTTEKRS